MFQHERNSINSITIKSFNYYIFPSKRCLLQKLSLSWNAKRLAFLVHTKVTYTKCYKKSNDTCFCWADRAVLGSTKISSILKVWFLRSNNRLMNWQSIVYARVEASFLYNLGCMTLHVCKFGLVHIVRHFVHYSL